MRTRLLLVLVVMTFGCLQGNAQSIQPFYTPKDVTFKTELLGRWDVAGETLEFRDAGESTYGINILNEQGVALHFRARLFRIGSHYFLDGQISRIDFLEKGQEQGNEKTQIGKTEVHDSFTVNEEDTLLNRHHGLFLVEFSKSTDVFTVYTWRDKFLPSLAERKKLSCPFVKDEIGRILLTGSSTQLRELVRSLPREAFEAGQTLTRNNEKQD